MSAKKNIMLTGFVMDSSLMKIIKNLEGMGHSIPTMLLGDGGESLKREDIKVYYESDLYNPASNFTASVNISFEDLAFIRSKYSFILRCLSRWDKTITNNDDRLFLIDKLFLFFVDLLKKKKIDIVLSSTGTPHHFYDLILTLAAEYAGAKAIFQMTNQLNNRVRFVEGLAFKTIKLKGLGSDNNQMKDYLHSLKHQKEISAIWTTRALSNKTKTHTWSFVLKKFPRYFGRAIKNVLNPYKSINIYSQESTFVKILKVSFDTISSLVNISKTKRLYDEIKVKSVEGNPLVLYAHFQPEATSHPDGGQFPDMRYWISYFKREYKNIYYKEHVASFLYHDDFEMTNSLIHKSMDYYADLNNFGIKFLDERYSTRELFKYNPKIFTFTGTVILEAVINGIEVMFCGHPWFGQLPGEEHLINEYGVELKVIKNTSLEQLIEYFEEQDNCSFPNVYGWATGKKDDSMSLDDYCSYVHQAFMAVT